MRVTDQITNRIAEKSGLPIYPNRDSMKTDNSLLSALDKKNKSDRSTYLGNAGSKKEYADLTKAADKLSEASKKWIASEDDDIYQRAFDSADTSEIASSLAENIERYNDTLQSMKKCSDGLNELYLSEMQKAAEEQKDSFENVGITIGKDKKLSFDATKLKLDNIETFRKAMEPFASKMSILSERISKASQAQEESISSRYDAFGNMYLAGGSKYDFWG